MARTPAHCGATHAGVCVSGVATTPTTHAVVPCALSLLSLAMPHLPHSHKCHASLHTHTHGVLCVAPPIHSHTHTGWLTAHTPSTHHHHWVCVCSSTCSHPPHTHTHGTHRRGPCMGGCWCGHHHHAPCAPPSHTHTAGLVVWAMVVLGGARVPCVCLPRHHHTRLPSHHHHQRSCATTAHTHTRDLVDAPLPHTHATCTTTLTNACCVVPTPCHSHSHATSHTHTQWCLPSLTTPSTHTHTPNACHTHHTGEGPRARTPVGVAFGEPPPPRWSWAFAVLCWWLLVHQPLFTLTHPSTPTPSSPNHHHHHPIHPVCVVCVVWERTAPGTTVVVKHATHTPVVHCVHGSHHPTLHPPLTPLLVLFPPPTTTPSLFSTHHHHHTHTTRPLWSSTAHSSASHTHTWCGWHVALWLLSRAVCVSEWWLCGLDGMHIPPLRPHTHTGTRTVALPIATPPLHRVCPCNHVPCVLGQPHHTVPCPGLLAFFASVCHPRLSHPPCVCACACVWWIGGWGVLVWAFV